MRRIVGLETEYGCLSTLEPNTPGAVQQVRDWIFEQSRFGLIDVHQRDWDEPPGNGGFLFNGGRVYIDMGHLEYCTPECLSLIDVLRYDRAGDAMVQEAVKALGLEEDVSFIRNNVDHYTGATFGCHENYLVRRSAPLTDSNVLSLLAFLTLRILFTGAGRVGSTRAVEFRADPARLHAPADALFQISQRADYINNDLYEWVQFNRAIINTRDEPLGDPRKYRRLHLLHGDTSVLPTTLLLKVGTTSLALDLLEIDQMPKLALADAVKTFRDISHQSEGPWIVPMADGTSMDGLELLFRFHAAADGEFRGRDAETDDLLKIWGSVLHGLAEDPESQVGRVDWVTKRWLLMQFMERENIGWDDPWLKAQDLEFHQIHPEKSLGLALDRCPAAWEVGSHSLKQALTGPPGNTRARARAEIMEELRTREHSYYLDWEILGIDGGEPLTLLNPFDPHPPEAQRYLTGLKGESQTPRRGAYRPPR